MSAPLATLEGSRLSAEDVGDAAELRGLTFARDTSAAGICVADGMGLAIRVERGALVVKDGMGEHRRCRRFDKATHGLSRLVVIGSTGFATVDALHWLRRLGIGVLVLAPDGRAVLASTPRETDDARLRRMQAAAPELPAGLDLARTLIAAKLNGQATLVRYRFADVTAADILESLAAAVDVAESIDDVRGLEATGAACYWQVWAARPETVPRFVTKDRARLPAHWQRYDGRRSVLASTNGNRKAERPANALLNYSYALLESEAVLACAAVGLDAGMGIVHLDTRGRRSLALDLIEPVRPQVDACVLDLLAGRTFRKGEFVETADGQVRLKAPLTHELVESLPRWSRAVAPWAERVAHMLGQAMDGRYEPATPLTRSRTRSAQATIKARKAFGAHAATAGPPRQRPTGPTRRSAYTCPDCGAPVADARHIRCDACIDADPRQTQALRMSRGRAISIRRQREAAWMAATGGAPLDTSWASEVLVPALTRVKLSDVVSACDVAKSTASAWRNGHTQPHPSHWRTLARLTDVPFPEQPSQPSDSVEAEEEGTEP